jgi:DNA polymerase IV
MDGFYTSIEQRDRPALRGRPVAVLRARPAPTSRSSEPESASSSARPEPPDVVVRAANEEAEQRGVRPGTSAKVALQRCPELVVLSPDLGRYRAAAQHLHAILGDFSRSVEPLAVDSCWIDVTDGTNVPGLGNATAVARRIRERVRTEVGVTCSIGVAPLKFVARLASQHRKPDGLTVVASDQIASFVHPLAVERLEGVSRSAARRLHARGVRTIGDLTKLSESAAVAALGRSGLGAWRMARGADPRRVSPDRSGRTRSAERTFPIDVYEATVLEREIERQLEPMVSELSVEGDRARGLTVRIRYASFEVITRQRTLEPPSRDLARLTSIAKALLHDRTEVGQRPVRAVGLSITPDQRASSNRSS